MGWVIMNTYYTMMKNLGFADVELEVPMKSLTSFKLGGPADVVVYPSKEEEILQGVTFCREEGVPFLIMGKGTNLLISDGGLEGVVFALRDNFSNVVVNDREIYTEAGALLKDVAEVAAARGLSGMEPLHGIPGSVGGAVTMNAGAYGGETKDVIYSVRVLTKENEIKEYSAEEMHFGYRHSRVEEEDLIVLGATWLLTPKDSWEVTAAMDGYWERRMMKQPLDMPSAGSTFKRPKGNYAGQLIDRAGLRGLRHGGAQVSEKHCGFVVNCDNATTKDVVELIETVQKTVKDKFGVTLETEVKVLGR